VLTTGNQLLPFCIIDLGCGSGYLRAISPHQRTPLARKILLADDSVTAQNMGRKILADAGYEVITVNNGSAALKKIAEQKPDLIVLDVYMPGYSGLEVCQRLKEAAETSRVPVLLTVGKLEPFKPEEAKRARADGFIVKPFEASELLSALSKLEDKIVPRGEASKPGRFARATAAIEEGRYDKTVAVDEDSGWRNRIGFPSKKKEKAAQADGDDPEIYNAMNKDLRTVVERKIAEQPQEAKAEEARVDLGALAPEGLPKDVTPEEIAALAAAAAQVKGKIAESTPEHEKVEAQAHSQTSTELPPDTPKESTASAPAVATFAGQKGEEKAAEKIDASSDHSSDSHKDAAPSPADIIAAIAGLELDSVSSPVASSGNGSGAYCTDSRTADEPVTMAVAAGAHSAAATSHWTAVSVAVAPDEAAISLEHEMQKAYAAFAAAEAGHAGAAASPNQTHSVSEPAARTEISSQAAVAPEAVVPVPASPAPEAAQALSAMANAATEAISAAVKELEAVAASYVAQKEPTPAETRSPSAEISEAAQAEPQASQAIEARLQASIQASTQASTQESPVVATEQPAFETPKLETTNPTSEIKQEEPRRDAAEPEEAFRSTAEAIGPALANEIPAERASARGNRETAKNESEMAATTAAAWASWRQIRESGDPKGAPEDPAPKAVEEVPFSPDAAAMAVAAGAEKTPEEASTAPDSDSDAIASIVDSVLADMRPKIFEEISRKMGKKK